MKPVKGVVPAANHTLNHRHITGTVIMEPIENKRRVDRKPDGESGVRLLDLRAAARYIGVSYWTMRDLAMGGKIPIVRFPCPRSGDGRVIRRVLIDRKDLDTFIDQNKELNDEYQPAANW